MVTPTQRLAPLLKWAAECAERGDEYEARSLVRAFELTLKHEDDGRWSHDIAHDGMLTAECYDFETKRVCAWSYAIAYVLLTEETEQ